MEMISSIRSRLRGVKPSETVVPLPSMKEPPRKLKEKSSEKEKTLVDSPVRERKRARKEDAPVKTPEMKTRRSTRATAVESSIPSAHILKEFPGQKAMRATDKKARVTRPSPPARVHPATERPTRRQAVAVEVEVDQEARESSPDTPREKSTRTSVSAAKKAAQIEPLVVVAPRRPTRASAVRSAVLSASVLRVKKAPATKASAQKPRTGKTSLDPAAPAVVMRAVRTLQSKRIGNKVTAPVLTKPATSSTKRKREASPITVVTKKAKDGPAAKKQTSKKSPEDWSFPCRVAEFASILQFVEERIEKSTGGCMLVEGVPGTGKTATVHQVIKYLRWKGDKENLLAFKFCEINGIKLSDPKMTYVHLAKVFLEDQKKLGAARALRFLDQRFRNPPDDQPTLVVLLDEMDKLSTATKQKVIYNLFDWPQLQGSQLIVVAISNTMDLPEKMLMARIESRIGVHRLAFDPYTKKDLPEIIRYHLKDATLEDDAMTLVCGRVAAKTGDARGALNIVKRARALAVEREDHKPKATGKLTVVRVEDISNACNELDSSPKILYMKNASRLEKLFLRAMTQGHEEGAEMEKIIERVMEDFIAGGWPCPTVSMCLAVADRLCAMRIIIMTQKSPAMFDRRLDLLCNSCDVDFATKM
ncbi:Origin recognition complex subunit 1 [Hypsibius exemplaris]|uniref:Origin recognition complex subunit 1 n=1 Tax=Hypsibius exemplaris TaxID=2072580 RepID=A0A1W0XE42_HYPEX|nr:Origin recognition complex subunit 1 [Hypsibius exemplaris]